MDRLKVEGHSGLERDANSKAIISTSRTTYESYMQSAMQRKSEKDTLRDTVREINTIKSEMHEIKSLLMQMMERTNVR